MPNPSKLVAPPRSRARFFLVFPNSWLRQAAVVDLMSNQSASGPRLWLRSQYESNKSAFFGIRRPPPLPYVFKLLTFGPCPHMWTALSDPFFCRKQLQGKVRTLRTNFLRVLTHFAHILRASSRPIFIEIAEKLS